MNKPLKICFDASPLLVNKTGVAYYTERLVSQLAKRYGKDIELVGFYYNFLGRRSTTHFPQGENIRYKPVRFIPSKVIYQLRRWGIEIPLELLCKERADFVLFTNFLGYPSLLNMPSAPVIHDLTFVDIPEYVSAKNGNDLRRFVPKQIKRSQFVVTVSEFSKQRIMDTYGTTSADIIVTPIPPEETSPLSSTDLRSVLAGQGVTSSYILFLSTIEPRKNLVGLIDAYERLPEALRQKYMLVVAGRIGWNCDAEIARLKKAEADGLRVLHLGYVHDEARNALFQGASLYVNSSNYEGFGMPVLEAMSHQTACALSDIAVFHEVAGDAAQYFDQHDTESIAKTLESLLVDSSSLDSLAKAGTERLAHYSWDQVATNLYETISNRVGRQ